MPLTRPDLPRRRTTIDENASSRLVNVIRAAQAARILS
jgi:hypothetical protein